MLIKRWLYLNLGMTIVMIALGAITRLEDAGLSMVNWQIIKGILPVLDHSDWLRLFTQYQQFPQYKQINIEMTLTEFKYIFYLEYTHRLWGRLLGLTVIVPALYFWYKNMLSTSEKYKTIALIAIGTLQGFVGWYMVQSGLYNSPYVSHLRLCIHLLIALLIMSILLNMIFHYHKAYLLQVSKSIFIISCIFLLLTIIYGALTAGLDAGLLYNHSFPRMGDGFIPDDLLIPHKSLFYNLIYNPSCVQFVHRCCALCSTIFIIVLSWKIKVSKISWILITSISLQVMLGIATLISGINTVIATLHQLIALYIFSIFNYLHYCIRKYR